MRRQLVDPARRPRHEIGDAEAPFGQAIVILIGDRAGHEPRFREQLPEAIRVAGEVMSGERRADARIDADEQHAHAGPDAVLQQRQIGRRRLGRLPWHASQYCASLRVESLFSAAACVRRARRGAADDQLGIDRHRARIARAVALFDALQNRSAPPVLPSAAAAAAPSSNPDSGIRRSGCRRSRRPRRLRARGVPLRAARGSRRSRRCR